MKSVFDLGRAARLSGLSVLGLLAMSGSALAHHPTGGRTPANFAEGLLSGFGHPIIGIDHFAFMVAIGLLVIGQRHRLLIPAGFVLMTIVGTIVHLMGLDLFSVEAMVALSVLAAGALLMANRRYRAGGLVALGAVAGLFHGYAYGESIVGAENTPLFAYLAGFSIIQLCVAMAATWIGAKVIDAANTATVTRLSRAAGAAVCSVGVVYFGLAMQAA